MKLISQTIVFFLLLLLASQAVAGTLETSFIDDIPKAIKFGDTPQMVIEAMGRAPDPGDEEVFEDGSLAYVYFINDGNRGLAYGFEARSLSSILLVFVGQSGRDLDNRLEGIYGQPKVDIKQFPQNDKNKKIKTYEIKVWEFENNAVILGPIEAPVRLVVICPLEPGGAYDLSKY